MDTQTDTPKKAPKPKTVDELQEMYRDLMGDDSEEGANLRAKVRGQLRRAPHDRIHPDEEWYEIHVPPSVHGLPFKINDKEYVGTVQVPACVLSTLLEMIDKNRRMDAERMRESGRTVNLDRPLNNIREILKDD